mgnify:CR=1 FL=1
MAVFFCSCPFGTCDHAIMSSATTFLVRVTVPVSASHLVNSCFPGACDHANHLFSNCSAGTLAWSAAFVGLQHTAKINWCAKGYLQMHKVAWCANYAGILVFAKFTGSL